MINQGSTTSRDEFISFRQILKSICFEVMASHKVRDRNTWATFAPLILFTLTRISEAMILAVMNTMLANPYRSLKILDFNRV